MKITREEALRYHSEPRPGKLEVQPTKPMETQRDLSLAYTPGVAEPVRLVEADPSLAARYTNKQNLVGIMSNGTAILGLGDRGALACKPVLEGKSALFKVFSDIDVYDIELHSREPAEIIQAVEMMAPTFGAICLEDIKAPECFIIEEELQNKLPIPVFHDDQHGTAIVVGAGLLNALAVAGKNIKDVRIVINGAGAAGVAVHRFLRLLGAKKEQITVCDSAGVIYEGRTENMREHKHALSIDTSHRTLAEALRDADVFIGVSRAGQVSAAGVCSMARNPIIFALANPDPEISYDDARAAREDAIVATGRSDFPNQVNNVLGFPFLFRGALDVHATAINNEMKKAAAFALAALAKEHVTDVVLEAYQLESLTFGRDYILPKPLDPRVITRVAPAVALAAMDSGVARKELKIEEYEKELAYRVRNRGIK